MACAKSGSGVGCAVAGAVGMRVLLGAGAAVGAAALVGRSVGCGVFAGAGVTISIILVAATAPGCADPPASHRVSAIIAISAHAISLDGFMFSTGNFARHARENGRDNFVGDRSEPLGDLVGGYRVVGLCADQHHWVAASHMSDAGHVDHGV